MSKEQSRVDYSILSLFEYFKHTISLKPFILMSRYEKTEKN